MKTQEEFNAIMAAYDELMKRNGHKVPNCHMKPMEYCWSERGEEWYECRHCGHTKGTK